MIRSRAFRLLIVAFAVLILAAATHALWMPPMGWALVNAEQPVRADAALVLAGDFYGRRILFGAELARQGLVPKVFVSGPARLYGHHECDLAIAYAVKQGYPMEAFVRLPNEALSTDDEAGSMLPVIRKMGVRRLAVVTSDYHTARAGRIFRSAADGLEIHMVAAPDEYFRPDGWWRSRQSRKIFFMEWTKTVAQWVGL